MIDALVPFSPQFTNTMALAQRLLKDLPTWYAATGVVDPNVGVDDDQSVIAWRCPFTNCNDKQLSHDDRVTVQAASFNTFRSTVSQRSKGLVGCSEHLDLLMQGDRRYENADCLSSDAIRLLQQPRGLCVVGGQTSR